MRRNERRYEASIRRHVRAYRRRRVERVLFNPTLWGWIGAIGVGLLLLFLVAAPFIAK